MGAFLLNREAALLERILVPWRRKRRGRIHEIVPLHVLRIVQRRHVRLPRLRMLAAAAGRVPHRRLVVLVRERREVMSELVYEHVRRKRAVDASRGLVVEDPAAAVLLFIDEDFEEIVRSG